MLSSNNNSNSNNIRVSSNNNKRTLVNMEAGNHRWVFYPITTNILKRI